MSDRLREIAREYRQGQQLEFVESWTFGQGSFGHRCRICLADDYYGELAHEPWCERIREQIQAAVTTS
jgi:hypothetical protein